MGLDTSHGAWHGAYSSFKRWRDKITEVAKVEIDYDSYHRKNFDGEWDEVPKDPLTILLVHSDCDGVIKSDHCGPIADRLEKLLPQLNGQDGGGHIGDYVEKTKTFIEGLRDAASANEDLDFH